MKVHEEPEDYSSNLKTQKKKISYYKFDIIGITIASIIYIALDFYFLYFIIDDAFITFRYSEHLSNGFGLDWNFGTDPTNNQGYTNFLLVIILSVFINIVDPIIFIKIISIFSGIGIFITLNGINKNFLSKNFKKYSSTFSIILACIPSFAVWTMGGLETIFFPLLISLGLYFWIKAENSNNHKNKYIIFAQIFLVLAALTRPEGLVIFSILLMLDIIKWIIESRKLKELKNIISKAYIFVISIGLYFLFCYFYYRQLLPNSFYSKSDSLDVSSDLQISFLIFTISKKSFYYVYNFIRAYIILFIFFSFDVFIQIYLILKNKAVNWKELSNIAIICVSLIAMTQINPIMGEILRFLIFLLPLLIISFARVINSLIMLIFRCDRNFDRYPKFKKIYNNEVSSFLVLLLIVLPIGLFYQSRKDQYKEFTDLEWELLNNCHIPLGKWLYNTFPSDLRLATGDCEAVPYYSKMWTLDLIGLNSKEIIFNEFDIENIISYNISIFVLTAYSAEEYNRPQSNQRNVYDSEYFQNNYRLVLICPAIEDQYYEYVFILNKINLPESAFDKIPSHWIIKET